MKLFDTETGNKCEMCNSLKTSKLLALKIIRTASFQFELGKAIEFGNSHGGFDLAFSDVNTSHPKGTIYFYKTEEMDSIHDFCSLQCAFEYSVKTNSLVEYPDFDNPGEIRGITPDILKINHSFGLSEELKYRGQPAGNF